MRRLRRVLVVFALSAAMVAAIPGSASAGNFSCDEAGLDAAIAAAGIGDSGPHFFDCAAPTVVPLSGPKTLADDIHLEGGRNLILSGQNTHTIFTVAPGVSAQLHEIIYIEGSGANGAAISNLGSLVVGGSEFLGNHADQCGGAIVTVAAPIFVADTFFEGNTALTGGAICSTDADVLILDSGFVNNHAVAGSGGALAAFSEQILVERSHFHENSAAVSGGAIFVGDGTELVVAESDISGNTADSGGGIGVDSPDGQFIVASHVHGNHAASAGGGLWAIGSSDLSIESTHFGENTTDGDGGAVFAFEVNLEILESQFHGNQAQSGGGIYVEESSMEMWNSGFGGNHASLDGGAMWLWQSFALVGELFFEDNHADQGGGAIMNIGNSFLDISDSAFFHNSAPEHGGAIYNVGSPAGPATLFLYGTHFEGNHAELGGAIANDLSHVNVGNSQIVGNHAGAEGGGLYNFNDASADISDTMFADNTAGGGGGGIGNADSDLFVTSVLAVGNSATFGGFLDSYGNGFAFVDNSALLYNSAEITGGAVFTSNTTDIHTSCIEGNTDIAVYDSGLGNFTDNWWGAPDGPSGPSGTGSGDSLLTASGPYKPFSDVPLDPCLFPQAPWDPGRPSSGVCEVLVWFDEATVISDTDDEVDEWTLAGVARFYDADPMRDRETAVIGITDFTADTGETVVLEQQWRTEIWAAFGDQIRFDDLGLVLYEDDGRDGDDKGTFGGSPNLVFECGDTLHLTALVGASPLGMRGMPGTDDSSGLVEITMTITTVDVTWLPPMPS